MNGGIAPWAGEACFLIVTPLVWMQRRRRSHSTGSAGGPRSLGRFQDYARQLKQQASREAPPPLVLAPSMAPPPAVQSPEAWALDHARYPDRYLNARPRRPLWPHQQTMVELIRDRERRPFVGTVTATGAIIADTTGAGKTATILQLVVLDGQTRMRDTVGLDPDARFGHPTLVVVPAQLSEQWWQQARLLYPASVLAVHLLVPRHKQRAVEAVTELDMGQMRRCHDVVIVTYDTLAAAWEEGAAEAGRGLYSLPWHRVVFDEGDLAANMRTERYAACQAVRAARRLLISATPFPNQRVEEKNSVLALLGLPRSEFLGGGGGADAERLVLAHYLLQVRPPVPMEQMIETRWVAMTPESEELEHYHRFAELRWARFAQRRLEWDAWMRRLCQTQLLLYKSGEDRDAQRRRLPPGRKMEALFQYEAHEMAADECALVFNEWLVPLREFAYHCERRGLSYIYFHGGQTVEERRECLRRLIEQVQSGRRARPRFILMSIKLARGIDGLQYLANHALFFAPYWNRTLERQSAGRIWERPGQTRRVRCVRFVLMNTIEEEVYALAEGKERGDVGDVGDDDMDVDDEAVPHSQ